MPPFSFKLCPLLWHLQVRPVRSNSYPDVPMEISYFSSLLHYWLESNILLTYCVAPIAPTLVAESSHRLTPLLS